MSPRVVAALLKETITDDQGPVGCPRSSRVRRGRRSATSSERRRGALKADLDPRSTLGPTANREGSTERVEAVNQATEPCASPHDRSADPVVLDGRSKGRVGALDLDRD